MQGLTTDDGDSKSHGMMLESQPYGSDCVVKKNDCIGHMQKQMGITLRNLVQRYRGQRSEVSRWQDHRWSKAHD